ncbi:hypothetical protein H5410_030160 [Solanum commersonii]|uniref:Uncharacterized protein n=1 Tax=Solanum commersonii TaxID=4109 RepID=A0A9J5YIH3_SOLCO|nr:hypothetical protein H5410_030160 [Solanum commersonii]
MADFRNWTRSNSTSKIPEISPVTSNHDNPIGQHTSTQSNPIGQYTSTQSNPIGEGASTQSSPIGEGGQGRPAPACDRFENRPAGLGPVIFRGIGGMRDRGPVRGRFNPWTRSTRPGPGLDESAGEEVEVGSGEDELEDTPTSPVTNVPNETTNSTEQNFGRPPLIPPTREKVKYQRPKTSVVWQFMTLDKENSIAICNK